MHLGHLQASLHGARFSLFFVQKINAMKATVKIDLSNPMAEPFLVYARTLPFAEVIEEQKMSFDEAVKACNGIPLDEFFDELDERIKAHFNNA